MPKKYEIGVFYENQITISKTISTYSKMFLIFLQLVRVSDHPSKSLSTQLISI